MMLTIGRMFCNGNFGPVKLVQGKGSALTMFLRESRKGTCVAVCV